VLLTTPESTVQVSDTTGDAIKICGTFNKEKKLLFYTALHYVLSLFLFVLIMEENESSAPLKRLQNRYRLVVMNDDTYEEVVTFRLSRLSVYVALSTLFILLVGLTVALLVLTPLKYYIPGYGNNTNRTELQELKMRTDSLQQAIQYKDQYFENLKKVLNGDTPAQLDTTTLKVPKIEKSDD